jgi:hypothetical protein
MFKRNLQFVRKNLYIPKVNREKFRINVIKNNLNNLNNLHSIQQYRHFYVFPDGGPNNDPEFLLIFILAAASYYVIKKL